MPNAVKQAVALLLCILLALSPLSAARASAADAEEPAAPALSEPETAAPADGKAETPADSEAEASPPTEADEAAPASEDPPAPAPEAAAPEEADAPALSAGAPETPQEPETVSFSQVYINPLYAHVIRESDLAAPEAPAQKSAAAKKRAAARSGYGTLEEAAASLRSGMEQRQSPVTVYYHSDSTETSGVATSIAHLALAHTGVPTQGDYLSFQYGGWKSSGTRTANPDGGYDLTITYTVTYYTSAAQELEVDAAVSALLGEIAPAGRSAPAIVAGVYDYITANVRYDYAHQADDSYLLKYTAYAALLNRSAVCQGFAALLYRLLLSCGVDCRVIPGAAGGEGHAWNLVQLDGLYYNADPTWDAGRSDYQWFLLCEASFGQHSRDEEYRSGSFTGSYPMAGEDYPVFQPAWTWAEDLGSATLTLTRMDGSSQTVSADVTVQRTEPDCTGEGTLTHTASALCRGKRYSDVRQQPIPAAGHSLTRHPAEAPDYAAALDGHVEYWSCSVCGRFYADAEGQRELSGEALRIPWETLDGYPVDLTLDNSADGILLRWRPVPGAARYQVQRRADGGAWRSLSSTLTEPSCADGDVAMGTAYSYRVRALVGGAWSLFSDTESLVRNPFSDVAESDSFFSRVAWGCSNGIFSGKSGQFHPYDSCTRGQFAVMLYRLAGKPSTKGMKMPFTDVPDGLYNRAVTWAYNRKIIAGTGPTTFSPDSSVKRCQVVLMLWKMAGRPKVSIRNPFTDVSSSASSYKAILWAVQNKITTGTSPTTFSPNADCSRWQLAVFLYKFNRLMKYV